MTYEWYVLSATVAYEGRWRGVCTLAKATSEDEASDVFLACTKHSFLWPSSRRSDDPVTELVAMEKAGFLSIEDLGHVAFYSVSFAETGLMLHVAADGPDSAELLCRAIGLDAADGMAVVMETFER